jgi:class 3 adenylate cyclase
MSLSGSLRDRALSGLSDSVIACSSNRSKSTHRNLSEAGRQVFGYQEEEYQVEDDSHQFKRVTLKLWWLVVGIFLIITSSIAVGFALLWRSSTDHELSLSNHTHTDAFNRYEIASNHAVEKLVNHLVLQDMNVERLAVAEYVDMPFLAVEMFGKAMEPDKNIVTLNGVGANVKQLWWLQTGLPLMETRFAWGGIPKLADIYYADRYGLFAGYSNECVDRKKTTCTIKNGWSYGFEFRPRDEGSAESTHSTLPFVVPNVTNGDARLYTVDATTGEPNYFVSSAPYNPRERPWYVRAGEHHGATIWTGVHNVASSVRTNESNYGLVVARAFKASQDEQVIMVAGSTLSLERLTRVLQARVTLAAKTRPSDDKSIIFIIDNEGMMIASSSGFEDVIRQGGARKGEQLMWNATDEKYIKEAMADVLSRFGIVSNVDQSGMHVSEKNDYIYSHWRVDSGKPGASLNWIVVRAQPIDDYKRELREAKITSDKARELNSLNLQLEIAARETQTLLFCIISLLGGCIMMIVISWRVSQPLRRIAGDMRKVASLELDSIEDLEKGDVGPRSKNSTNIVPASCSRDGGIIREVADIRKSFLDMANGLRSFSRYMDPHIVQVLVQSGQQAQLGVAKAHVTVFFSDIADFTTMAETLAPSELANLLSEYLDSMSGIIMQHSGVVGEFIGDEIMAWWNVPWDLGANHTAMAFAAAMEQQQVLSKMRQKWVKKGMPEVRARMGIVSGQVLAGNIGSRQRMKYGLVGDTVNLASRLEGLCKRYGVSVLVDSSTCAEPNVEDSFFLRPVALVTVKGRSQETELRELVATKADVRGTSLHGMYARFCDDFAAITELYRARNFQKALECLIKYQQVWPDDKPAQLLKERCELLLESPPGPSWSPVENLQEK